MICNLGKRVYILQGEFQEVGMELVRAQHVRAGPAAQTEWRERGMGPQELLHRGGDPAERAEKAWRQVKVTFAIS